LPEIEPLVFGGADEKVFLFPISGCNMATLSPLIYLFRRIGFEPI